MKAAGGQREHDRQRHDADDKAGIGDAIFRAKKFNIEGEDGDGNRQPLVIHGDHQTRPDQPYGSIAPVEDQAQLPSPPSSPSMKRRAVSANTIASGTMLMIKPA